MPPGPIQQEVPEVVRDAARPLTIPFLRFVWAWIMWSRPWLVFLVLIVLGFNVYCDWLDRPIEFFIGPRGGDGANQSQLLQEQFEERSYVQPNYFMTPVYTEGYLENYRRINADSKGNTVGYAMDGLTDDGPSNVQTILPMEWEYLHFLYRTDSLGNFNSSTRGLTETDKTAGAVQFSDWAKVVQKRIKDRASQSSNDNLLPSIYLGPRKSGTRSVAEALLGDAKITTEDIEATGIDDFQEMLVALRQNRIQGAFYLGPRRAASIRRAAENIPCTLINIDVSADLAKTFPFLETGTIPTGIYNFRGEGIPREVKTLAVRRVLIASKSMRASDAYRIAQHVQEVLPHRVAKKSTNGQYPAPDDDLGSVALNYPQHDGMWTEEDTSAPASWIDRNAFWAVPLLVTVVAGFVAVFKDPVVSWLETHMPPGPPTPGGLPPAEPTPPQAGSPTAPSDGAERPALYADIEADVDKMLKEIHELGDSLIPAKKAPTRAAVKERRQQIGQIYQRIYSARQVGKLDESGSMELKAKAFQLQQELDYLRDPPWHVSAPRKRRASKPKSNKGDGDQAAPGPGAEDEGRT